MHNPFYDQFPFCDRQQPKRSRESSLAAKSGDKWVGQSPAEVCAWQVCGVRFVPDGGRKGLGDEKWVCLGTI